MRWAVGGGDMARGEGREMREVVIRVVVVH